MTKTKKSTAKTPSIKKKKAVKANFKTKQITETDLSGLSIRDQVELRNAIKNEIDSNILDNANYGLSYNKVMAYMDDNNPFFEEGMIYCSVMDDGNFSIETSESGGIPSKQLIEKFCAFLMDTWG